MNSHELYRITPTWCSHCEPHIGCVFSDLEILICWISQKLWKFYWIIVKKENKICIIKTEGTGLSTRNLGSTWKIMHPRTWTDLKSCKPLTCSLLEDLFCFVFLGIHTSINTHSEQFWEDHVIVFPFFWLAYSPMLYLIKCSTWEWIIGLWDCLRYFSLRGKNKIKALHWFCLIFIIPQWTEHYQSLSSNRKMR